MFALTFVLSPLASRNASGAIPYPWGLGEEFSRVSVTIRKTVSISQEPEANCQDREKNWGFIHLFKCLLYEHVHIGVCTCM